MRLPVSAKLGPYEILAPLGAGGMGEVYKARDTRLERPVAIKVLPADKVADPTRKQRFIQEARALDFALCQELYGFPVHQLDCCQIQHEAGSQYFGPQQSSQRRQLFPLDPAGELENDLLTFG